MLSHGAVVAGWALGWFSAEGFYALYGELLASGYRKGNTTRGLSPTTVKYIHQIVRKALADLAHFRRRLYGQHRVALRSEPRGVAPGAGADLQRAAWTVLDEMQHRRVHEFRRDTLVSLGALAG